LLHPAARTDCESAHRLSERIIPVPQSSLDKEDNDEQWSGYRSARKQELLDYHISRISRTNGVCVM
jgi:hypothetical protein